MNTTRKLVVDTDCADHHCCECKVARFSYINDSFTCSIFDERPEVDVSMLDFYRLKQCIDSEV